MRPKVFPPRSRFFRATADSVQQTHIHLALTFVAQRQGRLPDALDECRRALASASEANDPRLELEAVLRLTIATAEADSKEPAAQPARSSSMFRPRHLDFFGGGLQFRLGALRISVQAGQAVPVRWASAGFCRGCQRFS